MPREQLEQEFLNLAEAEGVSDIEELNKILDNAVNLKTFLKATERVEGVAKFVAEHFQENVEPLGYKAFLVGVDREACASTSRRSTSTCRRNIRGSSTRRVTTISELTKYQLSEDEEKQLRRGVPQAGHVAEDPHRHREAADRL